MKKDCIMCMLIVLVTLFSLFSCENVSDPTPEETTETNPTEYSEDLKEPIISLNLIEDGKSEYKIVYSSLGGDVSLSCAQRLHDAIKTYFGADLPMVTEDTKSKYEILVGYVDRPLSKSISDSLREKDYCYRICDNTVVIGAGCDSSLKNGITKFLDRIVYVKGKKNATNGYLALTSADDYSFLYNYPISPSFTIAGAGLKDFSIVYESSSLFARYAAYSLQRYLLEKSGYALDVFSEDENVREHEILLGKTERTQCAWQNGNYTVQCVDGKLEVIFGDLISQEQAVDYLHDTIFGGNAASVVEGMINTVALTNVLTGSERSILGNEGDIRIITTNIYQAYDYYPQRMTYLSEVYKAYQPDVILLQEAGAASWDKSSTKSIHALMAKEGYETILGGGGKTNATPIVYNKNTLELLDSGYSIYSLENNSNSKSYTWGYFKDKKSDKYFIAFSTHFMYNASDDAAKYNAIRVNNAVELSTKIIALAEEYACPVFGGGDINCYNDTDPYNKMIDNGFKNVKKIADVADTHNGTCSPDAVMDPETEFFFDEITEEFVRGEIDTIFAYGTDAQYHILIHDILIHDFSVCASDHTPVLTDIVLK